MKIQLRKSKHGPVLTCIRRDATTTYSRSRHGEFFAFHDLMHFAVETTLGLRDSFFGLIARGWQIPDFDRPAAAKSLGLPLEASHTEFIVGHLDAAARTRATNRSRRSTPRPSTPRWRRRAPTPASTAQGQSLRVTLNQSAPRRNSSLRSGARSPWTA